MIQPLNSQPNQVGFRVKDIVKTIVDDNGLLDDLVDFERQKIRELNQTGISTVEIKRMYPIISKEIKAKEDEIQKYWNSSMTPLGKRKICEELKALWTRIVEKAVHNMHSLIAKGARPPEPIDEFFIQQPLSEPKTDSTCCKPTPQPQVLHRTALQTSAQLAPDPVVLPPKSHTRGSEDFAFGLLDGVEMSFVEVPIPLGEKPTIPNVKDNEINDLIKSHENLNSPFNSSNNISTNDSFNNSQKNNLTTTHSNSNYIPFEVVELDLDFDVKESFKDE